MVRSAPSWSSTRVATRVYPPTTPSAGAASGRKRPHDESSSSDRYKRQRITSSSNTSNAFRDSRPVEVIDLTQDDDDDVSPPKSTPTGTGRSYQQATAVVVPSEPVREERRARRFRTHPPRSYLEKLERATTQRMFVIGRKRKGTEEVPEEEVYIVGTTGNIYRVTIAKEPTCTCPDARKGNQCKHVVYVCSTSHWQRVRQLTDTIELGVGKCSQSTRAFAVPTRVPLISMLQFRVSSIEDQD